MGQRRQVHRPLRLRLRTHTNLTEIQMGLELLWRNNVHPSRVVMGLGFYGRSFTMANPNCMQPDCEFKEGARGDECTGDVCRAYYLPRRSTRLSRTGVNRLSTKRTLSK